VLLISRRRVSIAVLLKKPQVGDPAHGLLMIV
jgi:hypothetical protein